MNKKLLLIGLSAFAVTRIAFAEALGSVAPAPSISITTTASVVSQYMFRGQRLNGAGFEPTVEMAAGDFTAGVWGNFPLRDIVPDSSDPEIDIYGSYAMKLSDSAS